MRKLTTSKSKITFAGIDYHKRFIVVALGDQNGNLVRHEKLANDEKGICDFFAQFPGIVCAIETSRGFEWLVDLLQDIGHEVKVCNARKAKLIAETSFKTDKIDAKVLMELLARNYIPVVAFGTPEQRLLKDRLRWRIHLMRSAVRLKLRIHALLDKENKGHPDPFSVAGREYLAQVRIHPARQEILDKHLALLDEYEQRLDHEMKWIIRTAKKDPRCQLLMSIPGVGPVSALVLTAEISDVSRFSRAEQIAKYFGLVPKEDSSGDRRRLGPITKEGSRLARWILIQDAWTAIRKDRELHNIFLRVSVRRGQKVAIVAIARRLAEIAFNVLRHGVPYSAKRVALGQRVSAANPD